MLGPPPAAQRAPVRGARSIRRKCAGRENGRRLREIARRPPDNRAAGPTIFGRPWPVVLIAVEKGLSTLALLGGAIFALVLRGHPGQNPVEVAFARPLARGSHSEIIRWLAAHSPYVSANQAVALSAGLFLWAAVFAAETIGVWIEAAWGELLVIAETAAFLPIEGWRFAHHPRPPEYVTMPINLLILGYLVRKYRRRLRRR